MKKWLALSLLTITPALAAPYKMVVFTDAETRDRANEFKNYIQSKPPFSRLGAEGFQLQVVELTADEMKCSNNMPDAPRIITCDNDMLWRKKNELGAHTATAFTSRGTGGAGGAIAIASKDYPLSTMLHEIFHTFGLADEYNYSESERGVYCNPPREAVNVAIIKSEPPYSGKPDALGRHSNKIPWTGDIAEPTPVTKGTSLGTAEAPSMAESAGLYEGGHCTGTNGLTKTIYRPYMNSIMRTLSNDTVYPLYERQVAKAMESTLGSPLVYAATGSQGPVTGTVNCDPLGQAATTNAATSNLSQDIDHIYQHILNPSAPHSAPHNHDHNHGH